MSHELKVFFPKVDREVSMILLADVGDTCYVKYIFCELVLTHIEYYICDYK